jgi:hypothetical protein
MQPRLLILSKATWINSASVATAAATYAFMTSGYRPARQERIIDTDTVRNQNGLHKYIYDGGPGYRQWDPFKIVCDNAFERILGANASVQYANLLSLWNHPGLLGMSAHDGVYNVAWAQQPLEVEWRQFPQATGATVSPVVTVQFEEA